MQYYSASPKLSFFSVAKKVIAIIFIAILLVEVYLTYLKPDPLEKRLYELGYPTEGVIIQNNTLKFSDGHIAVIEGAYIKTYSVTAAEAINRVEQYLADVNLVYERYAHVKVVPKVETLTEKVDGDRRYWVVELVLKKGHRELFPQGYAFIDRESGLVEVKNYVEYIKEQEGGD